MKEPVNSILQQLLNDSPSDHSVRFTSDAIGYVSDTPQPINLEEWEWHEEIINGQVFCIITNKRIAEA